MCQQTGLHEGSLPGLQMATYCCVFVCREKDRILWSLFLYLQDTNPSLAAPPPTVVTLDVRALTFEFEKTQTWNP